MDLKSFSADNFSPKEWINTAWKSCPESNKEVFVSSTVGKLQLFIKQLTNGLDDTTLQIVRGVPRVLQDAAALAGRGRALRERLASLERHAGEVQEDTGHSIESLRRIDKLESALQAACESLRSADKWAKLASGLQETLENVPTHGAQLADLTDQVAAASASLEMLSRSSDYESKRVQLQVMFNRLEAALSPNIVEALTDHNAERASAYGALFRAMGRGPALARYWRGVESARLEEARRSIGEPRELLTSLPAELHAHADSQMDWLCNVIRSPAPVSDLIGLYAELVPALEPPLAKLLSSAVRRCATPADALNLLIDVRSAAAVFMKSINRMVENSREPGSAEAAVELGRVLHTDLLTNYTEIQLGVLTDQLATIDTRLEDHTEAARALELCAERAEGWARAAETAGRRLAGAAAYPHLLPALEALFAELCSRVSARHSLVAAQRGGGAWRALPLAAAAHALLHTAQTVDAHLKQWILNAESDPEVAEVTGYFLTPSLEGTLRQLRAEDPLGDTVKDIKRVCRNLVQLIVQCACEPCVRELDKISQLGVWTDNDQMASDLPDFSIAPQEYITQVGQYLMTLPQHLEPHLAQREAGLRAALCADGDPDPAVYLLNSVCSQTCDLYLEKLQSIGKMDTLGAKRCATDIAYLTSVVEELGGSVPPGLTNLERTLRSKRQ